MIYIVVREVGEYSDYSWSAQRAFSDEEQAKAYAEKMRTRHVVFQEIAKKVDEWEAQYKLYFPQPKIIDLPAKEALSSGDVELLKTSSPDLREMRKKIAKKRKEINAAFKKATTIRNEIMAGWYEKETAAQLAYIRANFSKQLAEFEISEEKLMGYHNWYYEPEWKVYPVPLNEETRPEERGLTV